MRGLLIVLFSAGCHSPLTEAVVTTDTDLSIPTDIDAVRWTVDATGIGGQVQTVELPLSDETRLPVVLPIVRESGPLGPIVVVAQGLSEGEPVVSRVARFHFVEGRSIVVPMNLARDCVGVTCNEAETCVDGRCVDRDVGTDAGVALPDSGTADANTPDAPSDGGRADVDARSGSTDAGPPDAGWPGCPEGCGTCDQTCVDRACECTRGCGCGLTCVGEGVDCEDVKCDGVGAVCTVDADGASNVRGKCEHEATCHVDAESVSNLTYECKSGAHCDVACTDVSNCRVACTGGAVCRLTCTRTSTCEHTSCDGIVTVCLDGSRVCNGPCP